MTRRVFFARRLEPLLLVLALLASCGSDEEPQPAVEPSLAAACTGMVDLRSFPGPMETAADLESYVNQQNQTLERLAGESPERSLQAGVNLKRLTEQNELDELIDGYGLEWLNIYWDSPSGDRGAISRSVGPQSLNALPGATAYYFTVEPMSTSRLKELADEEDVYLVDVGRIDELDEATASGTCARFTLPEPLWNIAQRLNVPLE